jgi:hypothetical protein
MFAKRDAKSVALVCANEIISLAVCFTNFDVIP